MFPLLPRRPLTRASLAGTWSEGRLAPVGVDRPRRFTGEVRRRLERRALSRLHLSVVAKRGGHDLRPSVARCREDEASKRQVAGESQGPESVELAFGPADHDG